MKSTYILIAAVTLFLFALISQSKIEIILSILLFIYGIYLNIKEVRLKKSLKNSGWNNSSKSALNKSIDDR